MRPPWEHVRALEAVAQQLAAANRAGTFAQGGAAGSVVAAHAAVRVKRVADELADLCCELAVPHIPVRTRARWRVRLARWLVEAPQEPRRQPARALSWRRAAGCPRERA